jgi:hypothetical protein
MTWLTALMVVLLSLIAFVLYLAILSNLIRVQVEHALRRFLHVANSPKLEGESYVLVEAEDKLITWIAIPGSHGMNIRRAEALAQRINRALSHEEINQAITEIGYAQAQEKSSD